MNKKIVQKWITELKKFAKEPSFRQLRFPMRMESDQGDLFSPEGILCELHSVEIDKEKWLPEKPKEEKQLRGNMTYFGEYHVAPKQVLEWIDITPAEMSSIRQQNSDGGFEKVITYLETLLN